MAESRPSLAELIDMQIRLHGPMSVATYMGLCLTHPAHGYYTSGDPLGRSGDFVTAPEISQMFGELLGLFVVDLWQQMGEPRTFTLLELGPGRGTLMADLLRAAGRAPGFSDALHLQLFETNPALREQQRLRLGAYAPFWPEEIDAVADDPLIVVANEFLDALPIQQFVRSGAAWFERQVGLIDGRRAFGLSPVPIPAAAMPPEIGDAPSGAVLEISPAREDVVAGLSRRIARQGGALLAIDYGYRTSQTGETLQAVRDHAFADPLAEPGLADLSAHVDFAALERAARGAGLAVAPLAAQGDFLMCLGIAERAAALARANPGETDTIAAALRRLVAREEMGEIFKVFCAHSPGLRPVGLAA